MAEETQGFLSRAYGLNSTEKTRAFYQDWAKTYDEEMRVNGYSSPPRTAKAMAACVQDVNAPLLDLGCGTGISGEALRDAGFTTLDGTDLTEEMLLAAETKDIYRKLTKGDLNQPIPAAPGEYANITAIGVFSPGHAPPEIIRVVVDLLPAKGCFGFSLNDHALEEPGYEALINDLVRDGTIEVAFKDYGEHMPGIGLKSMIYVLRRH